MLGQVVGEEDVVIDAEHAVDGHRHRHGAGKERHRPA